MAKKKKDSQHNGQKKSTKEQTTLYEKLQKSKDRATQTLLKTRGELIKNLSDLPIHVCSL